MKRKILVVFVLLMILSFSACVNNDSSSQTDISGSQDDTLNLQTDVTNNANTHEEESTIFNACKHTWDQWKQTVKPTCDSFGIQTRKCINCSKEESGSLQKLSHKNSDWIVDEVSTIKTEGKRHIECIYCKKVIKEEPISKINANHNHVGSYYSVIKQPTCDSEGSKEFICSCGTTVRTYIISATAHTVVIDDAVAASCERAGLTEGKHCSVCNTIIVKQTVVPQKDHIYGSWQVMVQPTETSTGLRNKMCKVCALGITETIPAIKDSDSSELNILLFELRNDGYWVTGIQSCTNPFLTIPSTYQGKPVVGISEKAFYKNTVLKEVVIPDNVKTFEYRAFYKCTSLKKVILPNSIKNIPQGMFEGCSELTEINLPDSIQSIGSNAFSSCTKLNFGTITLKCTLGHNCFYGVSFDTLTINNEVLTAGLSNAKINKLILAEGLKTIEKEALMWAKIGDIAFPTTLTTIKNGALYGVGVERLVLRSSVHLDYGAFNNCKMKEIVIPSGTTFDKCVFMNCENLETIYYGGTRAEWSSLISNYGYTLDDYQFIGELHVVCSDD